MPRPPLSSAQDADCPTTAGRRLFLRRTRTNRAATLVVVAVALRPLPLALGTAESGAAEKSSREPGVFGGMGRSLAHTICHCSNPVTHRDQSALDGVAKVFAAQLAYGPRSEEHTSELQSRGQLVCRLVRAK